MIKVNKKGGGSVAVGKYNGWTGAWKAAKKAAGWLVAWSYLAAFVLRAGVWNLGGY